MRQRHHRDALLGITLKETLHRYVAAKRAVVKALPDIETAKMKLHQLKAVEKNLWTQAALRKR